MAKTFLRYENFLAKLRDLLGGEVTKRALLLKSIVTCALIAWYVNPSAGTVVAIFGNLVWLWIAPENESKFVRQEIARAVKEVHQELEDVRKQLQEVTAKGS